MILVTVVYGCVLFVASATLVVVFVIYVCALFRVVGVIGCVGWC